VVREGTYITTNKPAALPFSSTFHLLPKHNNILQALYRQSHNRVDNIIIILLQSLDSLVSRNIGLRHDEFDILVLDTLSINWLSIILVIVLLVVAGLDGLALAVRVAVGVVVAGVVVSSVVVRLLSCEGLSGGCLSLGVEILDLGFTEDAGLCQKDGRCVVEWLLTYRCCWLGTCRPLGC
jgi:hypothetical protein